MGSKIKTFFLHASWPQRILVVGVIALLAWVTLTKVFGVGSQKPQYQTAQVDRGSVIAAVSESGNVSSTSSVNVGSPTTGIIEEVYVKNGDEVTAGENLFKVKSTATPQEQASAYAAYQNDQNALTSAQDNQQSLDAQMWTAQKSYLDAQNAVNAMQNNSTNPATKQAYTDLEKASLISTLTETQKNFAAAEQKYKDAGGAISSAQAQADAAWLSYQATQDSVVTAPIAGTVANFSGTIGSTVSASSGGGGENSTSSSTASSTSTAPSSSSSPVLVIGNFSDLTIKVQVSEVDVPSIHAGQKATITLDALTDKTFAGVVDSIDTIGTTSSGVVTFNAYISFVSPPSDIYPGMAATATIQTDRKDDVLKVPTSAVQTSNGQSYVRELKNGQLTQVPVEIGIASDSETEIVSGVAEGDTVVTSVITPTTRSTSTQGSSPFSGLGGGRGGFGGGFSGRTGGAAAGR